MNMKKISNPSVEKNEISHRGNKILYSVTFLFLLFSLFRTGGKLKAQESPKENPNIVLINADDLGYGDLGCYGATKVQTPNIDRDRPTLASLLQEAGYATACVGKWHLGFGEDQPDWNGLLKPGPLELGFDYYFGLPMVNSGPPFVYVENHQVVGLNPDDPFVYGERSITREWPAKGGYNQIGGAKKAHALYMDQMIGTTFTDTAVNWMKSMHRRNEKKPFFLYLATSNIHHPFTPAPRFIYTSDCGRYGNFIHELDWIVGEVLSALKDMGVADNTLVIFTSDNGGMLNQGGQDAWRAGHRLNGKLLGFR